MYVQLRKNIQPAGHHALLSTLSQSGYHSNMGNNAKASMSFQLVFNSLPVRNANSAESASRRLLKHFCAHGTSAQSAIQIYTLTLTTGRTPLQSPI